MDNTNRPEMGQRGPTMEDPYRKQEAEHQARLEEERRRRSLPIVQRVDPPAYTGKRGRELLSSINAEIADLFAERERHATGDVDAMPDAGHVQKLISMTCAVLRRLDTEWYPVNLEDLQAESDRAAETLRTIETKLRTDLAKLGWVEDERTQGRLPVEAIVSSHPQFVAAAVRARELKDAWSNLYNVRPHREELETAMAIGRRVREARLATSAAY